MNLQRGLSPVVCLLVGIGTAVAQHRVNSANTYARIYAIVPMIGSGTWNDPKRPMFAPLPQEMTSSNRTGIIAFNQVQSDDGNFALIEIVAANKQQLLTIIGPVQAQLSTVPGFQLFDRSTTSTATVQSAFQALKKNFDITKFRVVAP